MGTIYKITNKINGKIYIGKTIRNPHTRWLEHIQYSKMPSRYNTPLYLAMRKYGVENFSFKILEDNIDDVDLLNEKEKIAIIKYNSTSHQNGYNVATGGDGGRISCKLTEEQVSNIIEILSDKNNFQSFRDIGKIFNISGSVIRAINLGEYWFRPNIEYPIRKYDVTGLTLSREQYKRIIEDIQNSSLTLQDIVNKYNLSTGQISAINYGKYCYSKENEYYKGLYNGNFPIRENKHPKIEIDEKKLQLIFL